LTSIATDYQPKISLAEDVVAAGFLTQNQVELTYQTIAGMSDYVSLSNLPAMFLALCQQGDETYVSWSVIAGCSYV